MKRLTFLTLLFSTATYLSASDIFIESESFTNKGGWVVDQQFMDLMGSPYLMAHGLGKPVPDASTEINIAEEGDYHLYARTFNWTSPWSDKKGPGSFQVSINNKTLEKTLGDHGSQWEWQKAGTLSLKKGTHTLSLKDLTGFNGRCDAIYLSTSDTPPPQDLKKLETFRKKKSEIKSSTLSTPYDLVVAGGGIAGMSAAISAARLGCKVALINDRPVLGGNNSSEIRVHLGGQIDVGKYKKLGGLQKEFGPTKMGNAGPAEIYADHKKDDAIAAESNITFYPNFRLVASKTENNTIQHVIIQHIETGEEITLSGHTYSDCTGDGTLGALSGADYRMGREAQSEFKEAKAPKEADKMTMGASVQWNTKNEPTSTTFPLFEYGVEFTPDKVEKVTMGEWTWETGMNLDQIKDFERIRDYGLLVVFSNWSFLKNKLPDNSKFSTRSLDWVAYISGKRESRRLLGDHILTQNDLQDYVEYEDGTGCTTWSIDLHYPDKKNEKQFPSGAFKSYADHTMIYPYPIPYRCLYSRNIENLFMAGRNISVTHVALGTVRVMRTTGIMGEVVGMAATLCKKHNTSPRKIYQSHLPELKQLMEKGVGGFDLPNNQKYNTGGGLKEKPKKKS